MAAVNAPGHGLGGWRIHTEIGGIIVRRRLEKKLSAQAETMNATVGGADVLVAGGQRTEQWRSGHELRPRSGKETTAPFVVKPDKRGRAYFMRFLPEM